MQPPGTERSIRFYPFFQNSFNNFFQRCFQLRKTIAQQQTQVDALGAIIELALVNGQARRLEKVLGVHLRQRDCSGNILLLSRVLQRCLVAGQGVDLGQRFHDKTGVIMINKITHSIHGVNQEPSGF